MNCALRLIIHATDSQTLAGCKKKKKVVKILRGVFGPHLVGKD